MIHSVAHFANGINFVNNFEEKLADLNWAKDDDDVRVERIIFVRKRKRSDLSSSPSTECLAPHVFDTGWIFRLDDDCMFDYNVDVCNTTNARIFLQQLSRRPSSLPIVLHNDVLPSC